MEGDRDPPGRSGGEEAACSGCAQCAEFDRGAVGDRYDCVDLLCLDEFGYLELDKAGAKLLFQLFTDREERRAIAITTNAPFSEWPRTFTDQRLCRAIVDRMTFNANIVETGSQSYRVHSTQARLRDRT